MFHGTSSFRLRGLMNSLHFTHPVFCLAVFSMKSTLLSLRLHPPRVCRLHLRGLMNSIRRSKRAMMMRKMMIMGAEIFRWKYLLFA